MYAHTESFVRLRDQTQSILDFAVLISNSVPLLKMTIKNIEKDIDGVRLANPDYFKGETDQDQLKGYASTYKSNLGKYVLLSNFSYFEAYVVDAIGDIFEFHGGADAMVDASQSRSNKSINPVDGEIIENRKKLQDSLDKHKKQKYQKHTEALKRKNYKFPSELLSSYGVIKLRDELQNLRSVGIPDILSKGLHFDISESDIGEFHQIRKIRNSIAHGKRKNYDMPSAMKCNRFLRDLAVRIDSHIVNNFFVREEFS